MSQDQHQKLEAWSVRMRLCSITDEIPKLTKRAMTFFRHGRKMDSPPQSLDPRYQFYPSSLYLLGILPDFYCILICDLPTDDGSSSMCLRGDGVGIHESAHTVDTYPHSVETQVNKSVKNASMHVLLYMCFQPSIHLLPCILAFL